MTCPVLFTSLMKRKPEIFTKLNKAGIMFVIHHVKSTLIGEHFNINLDLHNMWNSLEKYKKKKRFQIV
jgi:uncharacterized membrane protein YqgA involved in biofilm formation